MSSRRVGEAHSVMEALIGVSVDVKARDVSGNVTSTLHLVRMLNELQDDLTRHGGARVAAAFSGAEGPERATAALSAAVRVADAKMRCIDAAYGELDACVRDLDRRLRLGDVVLRLHGQGLSASAHEEEAAELLGRVRPADAVSARAGRRAASDTPDAAALARARAIEAKQRLAAAVGGAASVCAAADAGAHDAAISSVEPTYCVCGQVAFGEMIACESESCPTEWFHSACVGLTPANRPLGAWFCPRCSGASGAKGGAGAGKASKKARHK
jgi:hypothetical protein